MRRIPALLLDHLQEPVNTTCRLLKITLASGQVIGLATLDRDVEFDGVTYSAVDGFDHSMVSGDSSFQVDNSEGRALISASIQGITADRVRRGDLDDATWIMYQVNYMRPDDGAVVIDAGDIGEVRLTQEDQLYIPELVSYSMRLKQTIGTVDSRLCRATFGEPEGSQLGCGVDVSALWRDGVVSDLVGDPAFEFRVEGDGSNGFTSLHGYTPGRIQWITGDNASNRLYSIEAIDPLIGVVSLIERLPFEVELGDTFRIRPDCDKTLQTCRDRWNNLLSFKGEPHIPTGDGIDDQTPQAPEYFETGLTGSSGDFSTGLTG